LGAEEAGELIVERIVFGAEAGDLLSVGMDLLPEGLDRRRLLSPRPDRRGGRSPVALHSRA
jgi:hypothetical protein